MNQEILSTKEVLELIGVSHSTLWRWQRQGHFPKSRQIGPRRVGILKSDLDEWLSNLPISGAAEEPNEPHQPNDADDPSQDGDR